MTHPAEAGPAGRSCGIGGSRGLLLPELNAASAMSTKDHDAHMHAGMRVDGSRCAYISETDKDHLQSLPVVKSHLRVAVFESRSGLGQTQPDEPGKSENSDFRHK